MQDFLVIKTSSLGDILQTLPIILSLKKKYPSAKITWVIEKRFASVLKPFNMDEVIEVDFKTWKKNPLKSLGEIKNFIKNLRSKTFDLCLDFQANTKSGFLMGLSRANEKRSFLKPAEWPHKLFKATRINACLDNYLTYYHSLLKDHVSKIDYDLPELYAENACESNKPIVMLGLGSMWPSKQLNKSQIQALLEHLNKTYNPYFLIPALPQEMKMYESLLKGYSGKVIVKPNLIDYMCDLKQATYFVGVDSALLHLARLMKVPSKAYFGPSSSKFYGQPIDEMGSCPYNICFIKRCPYLRTCIAPCMHSAIKIVN
jgi:heptosyltransferase I